MEPYYNKNFISMVLSRLNYKLKVYLPIKYIRI
jgi:hypothetical protein